MEEFFTPSSIAVIGAARETEKVGHAVLNNLIESNYQGKIFPVNPKIDNILGLKCYPSVLDIPENIDLGIIVVPASIVLEAVDECGRKGVKGLEIISAGFKEIGFDGAELEKKVVDTCKKYGIRLIGPNCLGVIDTFTPLNATFASEMLMKGGIAFISQSGALGTALLDWALTVEIGFSKFVSLGNKSDIDETDLIQAFAEDPNTKVILIYMEGLHNGKKFVQATKNLTRKVPIIIVKSGRTESGARAASSHTGSMAGSDIAYETAFKQCGIIRAENMEELFDLAEDFVSQPIPQGSNVVIVTNAGGPGVLATDACARFGLNLAPIGPEIAKKLKEQLPPNVSLNNPIDCLGDANAERYKYTLNTLLADDSIHSCIVILTPQAETQPKETAEAIVELRSKYPNKPVLTAFIGGEKVRDGVKTLEDFSIPNYPFPERAAYSLAAMVRYYEHIKNPVEEVIERYDVDTTKVEEIFTKVRESGRNVLLSTETKKVADAYGISTPSADLAKSVDEAVKIAEKVGYPIALKIVSPQIIHKSAVGGIKLELSSSEEVTKGFAEIIDNVKNFAPQASVEGLEVQNMVSQGKEMIVGAVKDAQLGHLIMFGLGGIYANIFKDVSFRIAPLARREAYEMITETKAYKLLSGGLQGEKPSDIESIVETIMKISQLVTDFNGIKELDINPLFVYEKGNRSMAIDVKIIMEN